MGVQQEFQKLVAAADVLGAMAVHLRQVSGDVNLPPELAARVAAVARAVAPDIDQVPQVRAGELAAIVQSMLGQATAFVASPERSGKWAVEDPKVLQGQGRASAAFAPIFRDVVGPAVPGLAERLAGTPRILDVGVGVAALAIAMAEAFPRSHIVGLDIWAPSLALSRANVAAASLSDRIEIREQSVADLDDVASFDFVWFSGPFIPAALQPAALRRCARALKTGGALVYGAFGGSGDPLSRALADMRTYRSGGPVLDDAGIVNALVGAGLTNVQPIAIDSALSTRMVVGCAP